MISMSARTRFTLLFAVLVGIILSFFSLAIFYLSENYRQNDFNLRLQDRAIARLKLVIESSTEKESLYVNQVEENNLHSLIDEQIVIYDSKHNLIYHDSTNFIPKKNVIDDISNIKMYTSSIESVETVGFKHTYKGNTYILFAKAHDVYGAKYIDNLKRTLTVRGIILIFIIAFCGWFYVGRILKPISDLAVQADKITSSNLNHRLKTLHKDDEIGRLTTTFNKMLERLETSFKIQKRFVSNASHEIRNPLTAISGQIDVALLKDRKPEEYKVTLESILKDIKNIRNLTNNLLELANSEVETIYKELENVRIDEILWGVRDQMIQQKSDNKVLIQFDEVVEDEAFLTCKGKDKLLMIAFQNIINNACKFSEDKTVEINVTFDKSTITLYFIDKGIGMSESFLKHVFEPFSRGRNTHGIPGNGIGMSLVHRIIKIHSGEISIQSEINVGTTVKVTLPNILNIK